MTQLILLRHGETIENTKHILQGLMPGNLTDNGKKQADEIGEKLKAYKGHIDSIICSDIKRCVDTADIVNHHLNLNITYSHLLRERDWGSATGMIVDGTTRIRIPDDAETVDMMKKRANEFLDFIRNNHDGQCILAISHGLFCRCLQAVHKGVELADIERMYNGEIRELSL